MPKDTGTDQYGHISYVTPSTVLAEGVYQFLRGSLYGAIWGMVTPFYAPGSQGFAKEAATGVFRPAPPFASLSAIPVNAAIFGTILGVQRLSCKSLELIRGREDVWNDFSLGSPSRTSITRRFFPIRRSD